ncbi:hypothetical protein [Sutterella sp.]|uniref:hypothetical protein n=1 Tax=Sutterella sp. TaxID=1981025 RepID=UPI0026DF8CEB|nr:hypothetical protein [Sutterella sp.]MDO5532875.1 hypothetical protein [Sutterella sp.]
MWNYPDGMDRSAWNYINWGGYGSRYEMLVGEAIKEAAAVLSGDCWDDRRSCTAEDVDDYLDAHPDERRLLEDTPVQEIVDATSRILEDYTREELRRCA